MWGWGQGGKKGSGRRQRRQQKEKKISAATTGRLDLKQNLLGDEGEGKKAGDWKEEKTEAGEISRTLKASRKVALLTRFPAFSGRPSLTGVRDADWAELRWKEMA